MTQKKPRKSTPKTGKTGHMMPNMPKTMPHSTKQMPMRGK